MVQQSSGGDTFFFLAAVSCVRARLFVIAFFTTSRAPQLCGRQRAEVREAGQRHNARATELASAGNTPPRYGGLSRHERKLLENHSAKAVRMRLP